jgi:hypothetical protein
MSQGLSLTPVQRFAEAGMLDPSKLSAAEVELINSLNEQEVTAYIGVAARLFGNNKELVKLGSLVEGGMRICVPL